MDEVSWEYIEVLGCARVAPVGGLAFASSMKTVATSKCPSRRRCMAMARLIKEGEEERTSFSAKDRGLSLNFCNCGYLSVYSVRRCRDQCYLLECFRVFAESGIDLFQVIIETVKGLLDGILQFSKSHG